jgi:hypothetical protein
MNGIYSDADEARAIRFLKGITGLFPTMPAAEPNWTAIRHRQFEEEASAPANDSQLPNT